MLAWLLLALAPLTAPGAPAAFDDADALLDALAARRAPVASLKARFVLDNTTPAERSRTEGELVYAAPRRLVFRLQDPDGALTQAYLFDHEAIYEYDAGLEQVQRSTQVPSADLEAVFAAFESDPERLRSLYDISLFDPGDASARADHGVLLRPKPREDGQPLFERVRIYLAGDTLLPVRLHVINSAESDALLVFGPFDVNGAVRPQETQLALPRGTMVVIDGAPEGEVDEAVRLVPEPATLEAPGPEPEADPPGEPETLESAP